MNTLTKIVIAGVLAIILNSCNFSVNFGKGVDGNRVVKTEDRTISEDFSEIKVSQGLDLYITQSNAVALSVEADENLHDIIMTEVENDILRIYTNENISSAASRKINLDIKTISAIKASSGSDVFTTNTIKADNIELSTSSGADMRLDVDANHITCKSSSGSDIKLTGNTETLTANASSGSDINASNLKATSSDAKATSGADIRLYTTDKLTAKASSGGDVTYSGNPKTVNTSDTASGSVRKQ